MDWVELTSSNLRRARHDESQMALEIEFTNGRTYRYFDVPLHEFEALTRAASPGTYFNENIKGRYRYARA